MKLIITLFSLLLALSCSAQKSGDLTGVPTTLKLKGDSKKLLKKGYKLYEVESGEITYQRMRQNSTSQWYFDRYGLREVRLETADEGGNSIMYIRDGSLELTINLKDTTAYPPRMEEMIPNVSQRIKSNYEKAKSLESEPIIGKPCEVWLKTYPRNFSFKDWVWKGMVLKKEISQNEDKVGYEASQMVLGHEIDESYFEILKHVKIVYPENN